MRWFMKIFRTFRTSHTQSHKTKQRYLDWLTSVLFFTYILYIGNIQTPKKTFTDHKKNGPILESSFRPKSTAIAEVMFH